jgi:hypothetical protein
MSSNNSDNLPDCKYGTNCYQRNPEHHKKFKHPKKRNSDVTYNKNPKKIKDDFESSGEKSSKETLEEPASSPTLQENTEQESAHENTEQAPVRENKIICNLGKEFTEEIVVSELPNDIKERVKAIYLMEMPEDFYSFYEFCKSLSKTSPELALSPIGLELVGPYHFFSGKIKKCTRAEALMHYRYYYDPPEFQTVLKGDEKSQYHLGYYRDDPNELPSFVASNSAAEGCSINCVAGNIFASTNVHIEKFKKTADPFKKMKIQKIHTALQNWCKTNEITLDTLTKEMKTRRTKVVTKTFHGAGIVVPYDKKTEVGYRPLAENDKSLKSILTQIVKSESEGWTKLQPVITFANIANDECDFGASLELGLDLFSFGDKMFHRSALQLLKTAYNLLKRSLFASIIEIHLANRTVDSDVFSIIL